MIWKILMEKADTVEQTMKHKHAVPDDGHAWKKYGQKFIKRISMNRSYFRCQKANCKAKKRADWSTSQSSVEVLYDGEHSHPPPNSSAAADDSISGNPSASRVNQYNLLNQVFGNSSPSDPQP